MQDVAVIDKPEVAQLALDPLRADILRRLRVPGSATSVAADLGMARQKVGYHLRLLEEHGLIELAEERQRRGLIERVMVATARSYALAPDVLGETSPDPGSLDRLSSDYLIAIGARLVSEVGALARRAAKVDKPLATYTIDTEVSFASPNERAAFAAELANTVVELAAKYHRADAPNSRPHRLVVAAHPLGPSPAGHTAAGLLPVDR